MADNTQDQDTMVVKSNIKQDSPLLNLPGELRNRIYRYVVVSSKPVILGQGMASAHRPILALVCRQLYKEVSSIHFEENKFIFYPGAFSLKFIDDFRRFAGVSAPKLRTVQILRRVDYPESYGQLRFEISQQTISDGSPRLSVNLLTTTFDVWPKAQTNRQNEACLCQMREKAMLLEEKTESCSVLDFVRLYRVMVASLDPHPYDWYLWPCDLCCLLRSGHLREHVGRVSTGTPRSVDCVLKYSSRHRQDVTGPRPVALYRRTRLWR